MPVGRPLGSPRRSAEQLRQATGAGEVKVSDEYRSKDGPLGPEKFENDLQPIDEEALVTRYEEAFIAELKAHVAAVKALVIAAYGS